VVRRNKIQHSCGDLACKEKIRMFKFIKSEYLITIKCAYCRKNNKKDYNLYPGIGGYLASVILAECGDFGSITKEFSSYIGLVPGMYNSGECLGITRGVAHNYSSSYLVEAA
jgi:hypothetical protein